MKYLDLFEELASIEQFKHDVEGVFGLEDLAEFHVAVAVEVPDDFDLFDQALFSILLTISSLFGKGLHRVFLLVLEPLDHIDGREVAPSDLFYWLELLMEAHLVEVFLEDVSPLVRVLPDQFKTEFELTEVEGDGVLRGHEPEIK